MAMDIVLAIASKIAEYMFVPVGRQFGYIIFYNSNVDNLGTMLQKLEEVKVALQHSVDAAIGNGEEIEGHVQNWLAKADGTVDDAKNNIEGHERVGCFDMWTRHQLSRKATKMATEISQVITEGKFEKISYRPTLPVAISPAARGYKALHSRTLILSEIMQALKDASIYKIGVYGTSGVGKTTLVKELVWRVEQDVSFGSVVIATVTSSVDVRKIQGQLADGLGLKFDEETEDGRARRLCDRIKKVNSIVVILDDIWSKLDLTEVGIPFSDDHKGCKLVLTSRDRNVLNDEMGTQKDFMLEFLRKDESWILFEKMAGNFVEDSDIKPTALEVARSCAGLPLLIVTVANALKNKELSNWKDALKRLTKIDHEGLGSNVYSAIELSYNHLESDELKSFFLFIASIANGVFIMDLLIYGWGLGLFKHVDTLADARNRAYKLTGDLRAKCLLLEGERGYIGMHDIIYEMASKIASKLQPFFAMPHLTELTEWPKPDILRKCHSIFFSWCHFHELPESLEWPEVELLCLSSRDNFLKSPDDCFAGMKKLKVLDFGGFNCCPSPPSSFCHLTNLRSLYLCKSMLEDITVVAKLTNLEILSLDRSEIKQLPIELAQLTRLRLLDLSHCSGLTVIPANLLSSLTCMEELYMGNCFIQWEAEGSKDQRKNASLGELRNLHNLKTLTLQIQHASILPRDLLIFGKLERYVILIGCGWKWSWFDLTKCYGNSRTLMLNLDTAAHIHLDRGVQLLFKSVEELYLAKLRGIRNVLYQLNGEGFLQLKHLEIQDSDEIEYIVDATEWVNSRGAFPNLESLVLHNLLNMKKISHGLLPVQFFAKLKVIKVKGCDGLENFQLYSIIRGLSQLVEVEISQCKSMTKIILDQGEEDKSRIDEMKSPKLISLTLDCLPKLVSFCCKPLLADKSTSCAIEDKNYSSNPLALFDEKVALPNLETMKLSSVNTWKIWDDKLSTHSFIQNLSSLIVDRCHELRYLFSSSVTRALGKLQYLEITNCQMLEEIFFFGGETSNVPSALKTLSNEEVTLPNLETLIISQMDNLKSIWHDQLAPKSFCKLKKMGIKFCNKLLNAFPSYVLNKLPNLETVAVANCDALEVVYEIPGLNNRARSNCSLRTLTLEHLPVLKHIWSKDPQGSLNCQNLCTVIATKCESLNHVIPFSVAKELMHLQELHIENCAVENIVSKDESADTAPIFVFPRLTSLSFSSLAQLRSFYPGTHSLNCPILKKLIVFHCDKLEAFMPKPQNYKKRVLVDPQPLFSIEKVIHGLEELVLDSKDFMKICNGQLDDELIYTVKNLCLQCFHDESEKFPSSFLQKFTNLESLKVSCSSFSDIILNEHTETTINMRSLMVIGLKNLKYLCKEKSEMKPTLQNLETLQVFECPTLKNIVPSSVLFQNLDTLHVLKCNWLMNITTLSTARSFMKLRRLAIRDCEMIEEIVVGEKEDAGELAFMKLEILILGNLPRLTSFCKGSNSFKFPLLKVIVVKECPMMETFSMASLSTPSLRQVQVTLTRDVWRWEGDVNATIKKLYNETNPKKD